MTTAAVPSSPVDAATVVVLRDRPSGLEVYLVRRSKQSAFMGGVYVFPGGKVDPADADPAFGDAPDAGHVLGLMPDRARAHFVAAVRETLEEAGIWLGAPAPPHAIDAVRDGLRAKQPFAALVAAHGLHVTFDALRYLSHWVTPSAEPRRFSARFFLARSPAGDHGGIDDHEIIDGLWARPSDAIARYAASEIDLAPPTLRTLAGLVGLPNVDAALATAPHAPVVTLAPELVFESGSPRLVLGGDPLHPHAPGETRRRFEMEGRRWKMVFEG